MCGTFGRVVLYTFICATNKSCTSERKLRKCFHNNNDDDVETTHKYLKCVFSSLKLCVSCAAALYMDTTALKDFGWLCSCSSPGR